MQREPRDWTYSRVDDGCNDEMVFGEDSFFTEL